MYSLFLPISINRMVNTMVSELETTTSLWSLTHTHFPSAVKLNPPVGLRLQRKGRVLELTWEVKAGYKRVHCIQSRVQYALNDKWQVTDRRGWSF